jgi:hypothetical protein
MDLHIVFLTHGLPFWFLVLALFLPRLSLAIMWLGGGLEGLRLIPLVGLLLWAFLPRVLVLLLIYAQQGICLWFLIHLAAAVMVWGGSGTYHARRRRRRDDF